MRTPLLPFLFLLSSVAARPDRSDSALAGISNHGANPGQPYATAGDRAYLVGTQDGGFPDLGWHVPGEMAGLWLHPIKLVDGFWATVEDSATGRAVELSRSTEMITYPHGTRFRYEDVLDGLDVERFQFSPDHREGLVVRYALRNRTERPRHVRLVLVVRTDLRPVWLADSLGIEDARDSVAWRDSSGIFLARDTRNPWFCVWGRSGRSVARVVKRTAPIQTAGSGVTATSSHELTVGPRDESTLTFVFAGSSRDEQAAVAAWRDLASHHAPLLEEKRGHYAALLSRARIRIPDARLQEVYDWVRINMEWLVRDVPGLGRGLSGALMDYPWWFGTETYSLQALIATGDAELARETLRLLAKASARTNGNGRIVHEVSTNGVVYNPGNTQETAAFVAVAGMLVEWTGDRAFAREMYPAMKAGIAWLLGEKDRDHDLFPEGYGIMEVQGLDAELIDVAVYTHQALKATAQVAKLLGETSAAAEFAQLSSRLAERINQGFWIEDEGSYADFFATRAEALKVVDGAIRQLMQNPARADSGRKESIRYYERLRQTFSALPEGSRGWLTNKNWVIATPMETGIAPRDRAIALLDKIRHENCGAHGPYLSAVERDRMMTIATGVQAVSECNYGRIEEALDYMQMIVRTFGRVSPGTISEMMPDYGCFVIAWTSYGIVIPLIRHILGIQPNGAERSIVFAPHLPSGWNAMSIENLPVGTNAVSFSLTRTAKGIEYAIDSKEDGWSLVLKGIEAPGARYSLNGRQVAPTADGIRMSGRRNRVLVSR